MKDKPWYEFEESATDKKSDFYKMKVGDNKVRVLSEFVRVDKLYKGEYPNNEYVGIIEENEKVPAGHTVKTEGWAWAIDRESGSLKILTVGRGILKLLAQFRSNEEYAFDDFPMPYDVTIHNTGEGPNRYSITPARKNTPVTDEELADLETKTPVAEIISKMKDKKSKVVETVDYPDASPYDNAPF